MNPIKKVPIEVGFSLKGRKYHDWTVIEEIESDWDWGRQARCQCKCGYQHILHLSALESGFAKCCRECHAKNAVVSTSCKIVQTNHLTNLSSLLY